jgi:A/G-specific adenine glycosylase
MKAQQIKEKLVSWFQTFKRDLPWRQTHDPYFIWLSEVILQQTRIDQGMPYYKRFVARFPTVFDLAAASEEEVLNLWQGLGYYNRARNLHHTAQVIAEEYGGQFPTDYAHIRQLKGIGEYTAAAIASMAFDMPYAVVDGNVNRVMARLFGIQEAVNTTPGKKAVRARAQEVLDHEAPGAFNEALMDFGAIQCTATQPKCGICPLQSECYAFNHNQTAVLPRKEKKLKRRTRYFYYLVPANEQGIVVKQRGTDDVWQRLFDFPLVERKTGETFSSDELQALIAFTDAEAAYVGQYKHVLTHQDIIANFYCVNNFDLGRLSNNFIFVAWNELENYALPRLIDRFLKDNLEALIPES